MPGQPRIAPSRAKGPIRFSVVTAVYNAEKYLDELFESLTEQEGVDFSQSIEVLAVDDGSTDRSPRIIKRWQRKYPDNIRYFGKENGGPASARNVGLKEASGEWITFIDADDFVAKNYFFQVNNALQRHRADLPAMVSCNYVSFDEATGVKADTHPLRFRFGRGERRVAIDELKRDIQATTNSAFFRRATIETNQLAFDERTRPGFEDTLFASLYLLRSRPGSILFLPAAEYFHRHRADRSSLQNNARKRPEQYADELEYGYLTLLEGARGPGGEIPVFVQNTVIFSLGFTFVEAVESPGVTAFLNDEQRAKYRSLLTRTFAAIEPAVFLDYDLYYFPMAFRVGLLSALGITPMPSPIAEITAQDTVKRMVRVVFATANADPEVSFQLGDQAIEPQFQKRRRFDFLGSPLAFEHICWVDIGEGETLRVMINGRDARLDVRGRRNMGGITGQAVRQAFLPALPNEAIMPEGMRNLRLAARQPAVAARYADAWLFMDRDTEADDSAEHLYRYVREHRPDINAFFVLRRTSRDWERFAGEGNRRLAFSEADHLVALLSASHVVSSHLDKYVWGFLDTPSFRDLVRYKFVWLQHGVTQGDFSRLINFAPIDCLITSTYGEFQSIVADPSPYRYTRKETVLTGMPRHDILLSGPIGDAKTIVIMPTWRLQLTGPSSGPGNARAVNPAFYESDYAKRWKEILHSRRLAEAVKRNGYRVIFLPHPNVEPYLDFFDVPNGTEVRMFSEGHSLQDVFRQLSLFITDYSSKAFDIAYLQKAVAYYQFDRQNVQGGGHLGGEGYFDYIRDGFGPVAASRDELLDIVERFVDGVPVDPAYVARASATFAFRDGKCRERVLRAILDMNTPRPRTNPAAVSTASELGGPA